jgi:hypothetical protein
MCEGSAGPRKITILAQAAIEGLENIKIPDPGVTGD